MLVFWPLFYTPIIHLAAFLATICPLELSLDDFKQGLICNFNLPICLRVGGGGVVVLDS